MKKITKEELIDLLKNNEAIREQARSKGLLLNLCRMLDDSGYDNDLSLLDLSGIDLRSVILSSTNLYGANLDGANLYRTILTGANLNGKNLTGANLTGADLNKVKINGANLDWADFKPKDLYTTTLDGASLIGTIIVSKRAKRLQLEQAQNINKLYYRLSYNFLVTFEKSKLLPDFCLEKIKNYLLFEDESITWAKKILSEGENQKSKEK